MNKVHLFFLAIVVTTWFGCETLNEIQKGVVGSGTTKPTNTENVSGLKEALKIGTGKAVNLLSQAGGYNNDPLVKIPFPADAIKAANTLRDMGMGKLVDDFTGLMNKGAEEAAKEATPIFTDAITQMTIGDATNILFGADNAATQYFESKTRASLYYTFSPKIKSALDVVNASKLWTDITTTYNKIPFVTPVNTNLVDYTTNKALDGLFVKLAAEERKIRKDPVARINDILKKVFSQLDNR